MNFSGFFSKLANTEDVNSIRFVLCAVLTNSYLVVSQLSLTVA